MPHGIDPAAILALHGTRGNRSIARALARVRGPLVQRYVKHGSLKISDDGSLALNMDTNVGSQELWGDATKAGQTVTPANAALAAVGSPIQLVWGSKSVSIEWDRPVPNRYGRQTKAKVRSKLDLIAPTHSAQPGKPGQPPPLPTLYQDCGRNTSEVLGALPTQDDLVYLFDGPAGPQRFTTGYPILAVAELVKGYFAGARAAIDREIVAWAATGYAKGADAGLDAELAKVIKKLKPSEREDLARAAKVNQAAVPNVAQGLVVVGSGKQLAGAKRVWEFHQAPVVVKSAQAKDYVTLENYNTERGLDRNTDWTFNMYGTEIGQSFHEELTDPRAPTELGDTPTTFVVDPVPVAAPAGGAGAATGSGSAATGSGAVAGGP